MKTSQEIFIEIYYTSKKVLDKDKYQDACNRFQEKFDMKPPWNSYISFKNSAPRWIKKLNIS